METSPTPPSPLLVKLEKARQALTDIDRRYENYDGNNPDKYVAPRLRAREHLEAVERECKAAGLLPLTEHEEMEKRLDATFPQAANRQVVEYAARYFQRRFNKATAARKGGPSLWMPYWAELKESDLEVRRLIEPAEHKAWREAMNRLWPFDRPVGGLAFEVAVGAPALHIMRDRRVYTWEKGRPLRGVHLTVQLTTTIEGWATLVAAQASREDASDVLYPRGLIVAGDPSSGWRLRKTGRAAHAVKLEPFGGDKAHVPLSKT